MCWSAAGAPLRYFKEFDGVICVRVCAPMALRVRVMMERLGVKNAEAIQQEIERFDAGHSRAMRAAFNFDWNDALPYDMVLNTARMPVDACVKAVCRARPTSTSFQDDPAITSAALADKLLQAKVKSALSEHISLAMAPNGISVSVADGKVTLAGTCSNGSVPAKAEKEARGIAGVLEINNRITSVPSYGRRF